jgi:methylenetetrahydrofolate reductase (NADPH)
MFFDNKPYFEFVEKCKEAGINVPIIPGIKPITAKAQATVLPTIFHIDLPEELADEVEKCKDNAAVKQVGIEWTVKQSKELMKFGVPLVHFYSMGKSDPIYKIAKQLF